MAGAHPGRRFAFVMGDLSEIQMHYALTIQDRDGHGKKLVQYNRLTLKYDLIAQLKESGRLPIHVRLDYKAELMKMRKLETKVNMLRQLRQKIFPQKELDEETKFYNKYMVEEYVFDDRSEQSTNEKINL